MDADQKQQEGIIEEAFLEHFGFPMSEVKNDKEFRYICAFSDPFDYFSYKGEKFLAMEREATMRYSHDENGVTVTVNRRIQKL